MQTTAAERDASRGYAERSLAFLDAAFGAVEPRDFAFRLWNGTTWGPQDGSRPRFTIVLRHPGSLRRMFLPPRDLTAGEAYIYDDFDIEGDIEGVACLADRLDVLDDRISLAKLAVRLLSLPAGDAGRQGRQGARFGGRAHSKSRDEAAIRYHYDVSNDFYSTWLDRNMVYSCAYFRDPEDDLDTAQEQKLDYLCRKLRLEPGDRLLDIGCGWGGLVMHAAREFGVDATGITLSENQTAFANDRIREAGLADVCRVELRDYRDVDESEPFDKLVSVGMFEHVGRELLPTYFAKAARLLKPGGVFLNHGISTRLSGWWTGVGRTFSDVYVFPDGELQPIGITLTEAEKAGFEVRDAESLREHYTMTLRHWVRRLEEHADEARAATDDVTYRVWRLFMSFSAHQFERGRINVHQSLLHKPTGGPSGLPLTRGDWYGEPAERFVPDEWAADSGAWDEPARRQPAGVGVGD